MAKSRRATNGNVNATKEERIEYIMGLMREPGRFKAGRMYEELMKKFNCSIHAIKLDTAEASRNVRREINDPDMVALDVGKAFSDTLEEAVRIMSDSPGSPEALKAMSIIEKLGKSWSQIVGADVPMRVEMVNVEATPAKAREIMREKFGAVTPKDENETNDSI